MSRNILDYKLEVASAAVLLIVPMYTWKTLYSTYKILKSKYEQEMLFNKRHNCVVMYSSTKGMTGWPPYTERFTPDISSKKSLDILKEPVLYFINTAQQKLDVAFMFVGIKSVYEAVINAHTRGVKVRLLLNFEHCNSNLPEIRQLIKAGISVLLYIAPKPDISSIMHYKFIIKDYTHGSGYVLTGSLNMSDNGFFNNYEDIVITSNPYIAEAFHYNFEECWDYVKLENEGIINKTVLLDACLD